MMCCLMALLLTIPFTSCADEKKDNITDASSDSIEITESINPETAEPETELKPDVIGMNFEGKTVRYLAAHWVTQQHVFSEGLTGDGLNDAVYERQELVKELLNVDFQFEYYSTDATYSVNKMIRSVKARDDVYSVVYTHCLHKISDLVMKGYLYPVEEMPHLDFDAPWWDKDFIETYRIGEHTYYMGGDAIQQDVDSFIFNKDIALEYSMPNLYDLVLEGKWTWEQFFELSRRVSRDLNGDGIINAHDQVGWCGGDAARLAAIPFSCDIRITEKTENGLELNFWSEKVVDIFEKTLEFFSDSNHVNQYWKSTSEFTDGRALFTATGVNSIAALRDSDVEFGILPWPKYDEEQEKYRCLAWNTMLCVPSTVSDPEVVGASLEVYAYASGDVAEEYYEKLIKGKTTRDEESVAMLEIIFEDSIYDPVHAYLGWDTRFSGLFFLFPDLITAGDSSIASRWKEVEKLATVSLEYFIETLNSPAVE